MKKIVVTTIVLALIAIAGYNVLDTSRGSTGNAVNVYPQPNSGENIVEITQNGFVPNRLTIDAGESVTFINRYALPAWPASNPHPIHTAYPDSSIDKCGTTEQANIFDACRNLRNGEEYVFTFNENGEWRYHDHLSPGDGGIIIVR